MNVKPNFIIFILLSSNILLSCTGTKNSAESILTNNLSNPALTETPISGSSKEAEKLISQVRNDLNNQPQYSLSNDDLSVLSDAGVDQADLKVWVK